MNQSWKSFLGVVFVVVAIAAGFVLITKKTDNLTLDKTSEEDGEVAGASTNSSSEPKADSVYVEKLAKFMTTQGMVMYGAYWCSHCNAQKELFGDAFKFVDYVECDSKGPNPNPDECIAQGIEGYPTWVYKGQKYSGQKSLADLAQIVGFSQ